MIGPRLLARGTRRSVVFKERTRREVMFKQAVWQRAEELVGLLDSADQERLIENAKRTKLKRKTIKRFRQAADESQGPLSLETLSKVTNRYAMWTVRRAFDWGHYPPGVDEQTRHIDAELTGGIYEIDVNLRRQVETLLLSGAQDNERAEFLRSHIEGQAEAITAALEARHAASKKREEWEKIAEYYGTVYSELDELLTLAGAPGDR